MIRYSLRCAAGHGFEAWFRSSAAFEEQQVAGRVACAVCGSAHVEKAPMAPAVTGGRAAPAGAESDTGAGQGPAAPATPTPGAPAPAETALAALRRRIARNFEHVGRRFATEARRIHAGEAVARPIWGEASRDEARALKDEGIPVAPLAAPLPGKRRTDD